MRTFLKFLFLVPTALVLLIIAIANRALTTFSIDPFSISEPLFSFRAPLFVFILLSVMFGVLLGGASMWIAQSRHRKNVRNLNKEINALKTVIADTKVQSISILPIK